MLTVLSPYQISFPAKKLMHYELHLSNLKRVARQESSRYSIAIRQPKTEIGNRSCTFGTRLRRKVIHKWQPLGLERKILGLKQRQAETETRFFCTLIKKNQISIYIIDSLWTGSGWKESDRAWKRREGTGKINSKVAEGEMGSSFFPFSHRPIFD